MIIHSAEDLAIFAVTQRKKLGLTQLEVADRIGLKQKTISAFENKPQTVKLSTAFLILSSLNVDLELIGRQDHAVKARWNEAW